MSLTDKKYIKSVNQSEIFDNTYETALPQTIVAEIVRNHLYNNIGTKKRRVLIYGFDGARADCISCIVPDNKSFYKSKYSAVSHLKEQGGLYLSFAGGDRNNPKTVQETSTAQGWCSILTGVWGIENGVVKHTTKRSDVPTVLMEGAENGLSANFSAIWPDHFDITYKDEIKTAKDKNLPLKFSFVQDENQLQIDMIKAIDDNTDIIFGICEFPDASGHGSGFSVKNYKYVSALVSADRYAQELIDYIEGRKEYENEDWLIIITSDHGGHGKRHGTQRAEDRMTFIAVNKEIG
ncbi:MAG: alkaline phosphatase family protein [Eubacterium sp.]